MKMRTLQWATKLQPEGKRGGGWRGEGWSGKTYVLPGGGKTQHRAQQVSSCAHLEGLLQARATTEKLTTVDRNGLEAAGARVRAEKETVPIPTGCRHKHPDQAHPDNRVQPPNPHHPFVMTSFIPKAISHQATDREQKLPAKLACYHSPDKKAPGFTGQLPTQDCHIS